MILDEANRQLATSCTCPTGHVFGSNWSIRCRCRAERKCLQVRGRSAAAFADALGDSPQRQLPGEADATCCRALKAADCREALMRPRLLTQLQLLLRMRPWPCHTVGRRSKLQPCRAVVVHRGSPQPAGVCVREVHQRCSGVTVTSVRRLITADGTGGAPGSGAANQDPKLLYVLVQS